MLLEGLIIGAVATGVAWKLYRKPSPTPIGTPTTSTPSTTPKSEIAKWIFGILGGVLITCSFVFGWWGTGFNSVASWLTQTFGNYWLVVLAAVVLGGLLIWAGVSKGEGAKKVKTTFELFFALAKVVVLIAIIVFLTIFIIGPKMFWKGDYNYQPPQQAAAVQAPAQTGITTHAGPPVHTDPKQISIIAPIGAISTPVGEWSEPLYLYGRRSEMSASANDGTGRKGIFAINADGIVHIVGPGLHTDIGRPNVLRFLSLTNFPLKISGRME